MYSPIYIPSNHQLPDSPLNNSPAQRLHNMPPYTTPTSQILFHSLILDVHFSRRLLLHAPQPPLSAVPPTVPAVSDAGESGSSSSFDANVVMILAVLLCGLICALGLNSIVRCALRCSTRASVDPDLGPAVRPGYGVRRALRSAPAVVYSARMKLAGSGSECAICLSEFVPGERVRVLPKCGHGFHARCVDRWLLARPSCPTCRQCLFGSLQKASGCAAVDRTGPVQPVIVPLEPEGSIVNYR